MADIPTVIREVTGGVWTFSRPFTRFGFMAIGGRSTAVRLSNGGVWVLASTRLDEPTRRAIDELGPVHYIVGADKLHYMFLVDFQKAYPEAKLFTVEEVAQKANELNIRYSMFGFPWNRGKQFFGLFGGADPWSYLAQLQVKQLGKPNPAAMRRDAKTVAGWDFERIIPCHGDVIEVRGKDAWRTAYKHWLQPEHE